MADLIQTPVVETFSSAVLATVTAAVNAKLVILAAGAAGTAGQGVTMNTIKVLPPFITLTAADAQVVTFTITYTKGI